MKRGIGPRGLGASEYTTPCGFPLDSVAKKRKGDPCWKGYEMVGMKKKDGRSVPNCVPTPAKQTNKRTKGKDRHFRTSEEGAGMTAKGVASYKRQNPGSKLQTAVTGKVKPGSKDAKRRKSFCARSKGWTGERGKAARRRWKC